MDQQSENNVAMQVEPAVEIMEGLKTAYTMEVETVLNYLAASTNPDGIRAREVKDLLREDVETELGHAKRLAQRIHALGGNVPGSLTLSFDQQTLQPPDDSANLLTVIRGAIDAEQAACQHYSKMIELCGGNDEVSLNIFANLLEDEEEHRREFQGFLKEFGK